MGILLSRREKVAEIEKKLFEMLERIEKMVKERKRVAMVVRADEIRGKEKRIEVLKRE